MKALVILASVLLTWDDPDNPPENVAGYHVYRVEFTGTGEMIRHRVNAELIPWQPDTDSTPSFWLHGVKPLEEYRGTAVGHAHLYPEDKRESEISDDFYRVPLPPVAVTWWVKPGPGPTP